MDWERELTGTCKVEEAEAEVRQLMKLSNSLEAARTKVGRWDGQTTNSCQGDKRQRGRQAEKHKRQPDTARPSGRWMLMRDSAASPQVGSWQGGAG